MHHLPCQSRSLARARARASAFASDCALYVEPHVDGSAFSIPFFFFRGQLPALALRTIISLLLLLLSVRKLHHFPHGILPSTAPNPPPAGSNRDSQSSKIDNCDPQSEL
ncbi:hypothetical protein Mapa_009045 [Marchantia paleacea]|nr:hypothetical protein Mapa_009045 [Marchantia paleacea]